MLSKEREEFSVGNVPGRDEQQARWLPAQEKGIRKVGVLGHHDPVLTLRDGAKLSIGRTVAKRKIKRVDGIVPSRP